MRSKILSPIFLLALLVISSFTYPKATFASENRNLRVLYLAFNPIEGDKNLAEEFWGWVWPNQSASDIEDLIAQETVNAFKRLSADKITYEVVHKVNINEFPSYKNGFQYNFENYLPCTQGDPGGACEAQKWFFDHEQWIEDNNVCELAETYGVDEIWVVSNPFIMAYETFMIGPSHSFNINGPAIIVPNCKKHYAVMNPVYHAPSNFLHIYGHRIEQTMSYLTDNWQNSDIKAYWCDFSAIARYGRFCGGSNTYVEPYCGNAHFPSNGTSQYDYNNTTQKTSTCVDWKNFPNFDGASENIDCSTWGCSDAGWQEYWFSNLPRSDGEVTMLGKNSQEFTFKKDWWFYLLYPENAIQFRNPSYNPTPSTEPTSTPTPLLGDINDDGVVNILDFQILSNNFGISYPDADFNNDGIVNILDFQILSNNFGKTGG